MQVINIHKRTLQQPKEIVSQLFKTLATDNDLVWPYENWPAMRFKGGMKVGSKGGHGAIRYTIIDLKADEYIRFQFSKPDGFNGTHELIIESKIKDVTEIRHAIRMNTSFKATILWLFSIRWLHDALIEEAFDKVENYFTMHKKVTGYNIWVKSMLGLYKVKAIQTKKA